MAEIPIKKKIVKPKSNPVKVPAKKSNINKSSDSPKKIVSKAKPGFMQVSIPHLDILLDGGIQEKKLTCIWAKPGVDATVFAYQVANSISKQNKTFYFTNSKSIENIKKDMTKYGFNSKNINFIDSYSALVGNKSTNSLVISEPKNSDEIFNSIEAISKKIKNPTIIIDSLSTLIDLTEKENADLITKLKGLNITIIGIFTEWPYTPKLLTSLKKVFDNIIELSALEKKLFFRQYFGVTKTSSGKLKKQVIPYRVTIPGGIKIYIPKILVTGPFNAGKTSFIHSASEKAVSVDRLGTTIALDHGHVNYKDFTVDLFGTPGQQRFDPILKLLGGEALGVVLLISAIDSEGFPRAIDMMKKAKVYGLPVVFVANKSNLRGALSVEQIKQRMNLTEEVVVPITAKDLTKVQPGIPCQLKQGDIEKVLDAIFGKLLEGGLDK